MACLLCLWSDNHLAKDRFYKRTKPPKSRKGGHPIPKFQVNMLTFSSVETAFRSVLFIAEVNFTLPVNDWWIDTRDNIHICSDQSLFFTYQVSSRETVTLQDNVVLHVLRIGRINLKLTSEKNLALQDVHYVSEIRRKLINESLLVQQGYKLVFESNKVVITKSLNFIGKRFLCDDLFKLNVKNSTLASRITLNVEPSLASTLWTCELQLNQKNDASQSNFQAKHQR